MRKLGKSLCLFRKKWLHIEHLTLTGKLLSTSLCLLFLCFCDLASLIPRPLPSFSSLTVQNNRGKVWDILSRERRQGREKGRENLIERGLTNHRYAA